MVFHRRTLSKPVKAISERLAMKKCGYCGVENDDAAVHCRECGTEFPRPEVPPLAPVEQPAEEPASPEYEFAPLSEEERKQDLVVLVRCRTLLAADLLVGRLEAAGIPTFIPDQNLMQMIAWNVNTYGYVRVQVSPKDYDAARALISAGDRC